MVKPNLGIRADSGTGTVERSVSLSVPVPEFFTLKFAILTPFVSVLSAQKGGIAKLRLRNLVSARSVLTERFWVKHQVQLSVLVQVRSDAQPNPRPPDEGTRDT